MTTTQLSTGTSNGTQSSTQSPQQAPVANDSLTSGQQGSAVQPGTPTAALNSTGGLPLRNTPLTAIRLPNATSTTSQPSSPTQHTSPALFGVSIVLFLLAVVLFYSASRPVKKTT